MSTKVPVGNVIVEGPDDWRVEEMPAELYARFALAVTLLAYKLPGAPIYVTKFVSIRNPISLHHPRYKRAIDVAHLHAVMDSEAGKRAYKEVQAIVNREMPYGLNGRGKPLDAFVYATYTPRGVGNDLAHMRHAHIQAPEARKVEGRVA